MDLEFQIFCAFLVVLMSVSGMSIPLGKNLEPTKEVKEEHADLTKGKPTSAEFTTEKEPTKVNLTTETGAPIKNR